MITIDWTQGGRFADAVDDARAIAAARAVLREAGVVDDVAAAESYAAALEAGEEPEGEAAAWRDAEMAANAAATDGWHDPDAGQVVLRAWSREDRASEPRIHINSPLAMVAERLGPDGDDDDARVMLAVVVASRWFGRPWSDIPADEWIRMLELAGPEIAEAAAGHVASIHDDAELGPAEPRDAASWEMPSLPVPARGEWNVRVAHDQAMIRAALRERIRQAIAARETVA